VEDLAEAEVVEEAVEVAEEDSKLN